MESCLNPESVRGDLKISSQGLLSATIFVMPSGHRVSVLLITSRNEKASVSCTLFCYSCKRKCRKSYVGLLQDLSEAMLTIITQVIIRGSISIIGQELYN